MTDMATVKTFGERLKNLLVEMDGLKSDIKELKEEMKEEGIPPKEISIISNVTAAYVANKLSEKLESNRQFADIASGLEY